MKENIVANKMGDLFHQKIRQWTTFLKKTHPTHNFSKENLSDAKFF